MHRKLAATLIALATSVAVAQGPYKVIDHWKIGGTGGWDYVVVDAPAHQLFLSHGPRMEVLDTNTGKPLGAFTGLKGIHGVAFAPGGSTAYVSDGQANAVVVFDRKTFAQITSIPAGTNPDGIVYEPVTKTVWAFNGRSKNATVIDTATNKVVATIDLGGKPEYPQVDGKGFVYAPMEDASTFVKLDAKALKVVATWKLTDGESPSGTAIDVKGHRLFAVCDGKKMAVLDSETGKQLGTAAIGTGPDAAGYSAKYNVAFSSNGEGTLSVIDGATLKTIETLDTAKRARTMDYDSVMDRVYLVTAQFGPAPAPTPEMPRPRPPVIPDSFEVIVVGR